MRSGPYRHRITIQEKTVTGQDSYGQDTVIWPTYHACWASVDSLQGREFQAVQQRWADARFRVRIRYKAGIQRAMRIVWGMRTLDILDAEDPDNTKRQIVMYCKELVS